MIVIADTTPIRYLVLLGYADLLPRLYGEVVIPIAVFDELTLVSSPEKVRQFVAAKPDWLELRPLSKPVSAALLEILDRGESEAIELAIEMSAGLILIDERLGRSVAEKRGLKFTGTLGLLQDAASRGWLDLRLALDELDKANFYFSADLRRRFLEGIK